jgi:hypothetical protein
VNGKIEIGSDFELAPCPLAEHTPAGGFSFHHRERPDPSPGFKRPVAGFAAMKKSVWTPSSSCCRRAQFLEQAGLSFQPERTGDLLQEGKGAHRLTSLNGHGPRGLLAMGIDGADGKNDLGFWQAILHKVK